VLAYLACLASQLGKTNKRPQQVFIMPMSA